jgi:hypothetical protein
MEGTAMQWSQVQRTYPHQWVLIEPSKYRQEDGWRILDEMAVVGTFDNSVSAWRDYAALRRQTPGREMFVFHTDRPVPDVRDDGRWRFAPGRPR